MGISGQNLCSYQTEPLAVELVKYAADQVAMQQWQQRSDRRQRQRIGIDASLLGYKYVHDKSSFEPDEAVTQIAEAFSNMQVDVVIVCDGPIRHPSKRASCLRKAKAEVAAIRLIVARNQLQALLSSLDGSQSNAKQIDELQKTVKRLENAVKQLLPSDFAQKLEAFVAGYDSEGKGSIEIIIAPFQADPCLAKLAVAGEIDAIGSGDSDFQMYIGPSDEKVLGTDLMLKDFVLTMKKEPIRTCRLYTGQEAVAALLISILRPKLNRSPFTESKEGSGSKKKGTKSKGGRTPQYPIFSGVDDPMVRALLGVYIGCDAVPGGVKGVGPKAAADLLKKYSRLSGPALHDKMAEDICTANNATVTAKDGVICLARSMLYEKTNDGYIHGNPKELERYLEDFSDGSADIIDGPSIANCKGCSGEAHPFLVAEGVVTCGICHHSLCRFCHMDEGVEEGLDGTRLLCFECVRDTMSGLEPETEIEMRSYLSEKGQSVPATATYVEVLSLFNQAQDGDFDFFEEDIKQVKYPILPTSALHPSQGIIERIKSVQLKNIGEIIGDDSVAMDMVVGLIHILASLTQVQGRRKGEKLTHMHVLPANVIAMTEDVRVHRGMRQRERGVRHAMDAGTPDILEAVVSLARHVGEVCLIIDHKVLASMKSVLYSASAAITATDFLAASCSCKAGCQNHGVHKLGEDRIVCTHSVAETVQLSLCMFKCLAKHVLVELRCRIRREGDVNAVLNEERLERLRDDIVLLTKAAGTVPPAFGANAPILEMLSGYASSTDQTKPSPGEPNLRDLGLLRDKVRYGRPEAKAEKLIQQKDQTDVGGVDNTGGSIPNCPEGTATVEEYRSGLLALDGLSLLFGGDEYNELVTPDEQTEVPVGFELHNERAVSGETARQRDYSQQHQPRLEMAAAWKRLLNMRRGWTKSATAANSDGASVDDSRSISRKRGVVGGSVSADADGRARKRSRNSCCVDGCKSNDINSKLSSVPDFPPPISGEATLQKRKTHRVKCFKRREWTDRLGFGREHKQKRMKFCDKHTMEMVKGKWVKVDDGGEDGQSVKVPEFRAPVQVGSKSFHSPAGKQSGGSGTDREVLRHALHLSRQESNLSRPTQIALAREGITGGTGSNKENKCGTGEDRDGKDFWRAPRITLESLSPKEVKRRTGFRDAKHLLSYSAIVYGGDLHEMAKTVTKMTFLEELMLAYQFSWGRSNIRVEEYVHEYGCSAKPIKRAICYRLRKELDCRKGWPMYASYKEDAKFRGSSWNRHFNAESGERVVLHDTTNIPLPNPSSGDLNRALHNSYYSMCCAKAGVAAQLCGWILGLPLVTGHSDDDRQIADTMILELQKAFAESDPSSAKTFLNIFDKGYHMLLETKKYGQICCQPDRADDTFGGKKVLRSGCVAVVRSGNERAVNRCKSSWFIKRGCYDQLWDVDLLCDVWEAFTFRVNFMYDKYL